MQSLRLTALLAMTVLFTTAASAHPHPSSPQPNAHVDYVPPTEFTAGDWAGAFLAGEAGMAVGVGVGGLLGYGLAGNCSGEREEGDFFGPCAFHGLDEAAIGALALSPAFIAGGIALYGDARGHNGSYWGALGGSYLGMAAAVGVIALTIDDDESDLEGLGVVAAFTLPAIGGTIGYFLSRDTSPQPVIRTGALIDVGADGVVRLAVPAVGIEQKIDDTVFSVTLVGGAL